MPPASPAPTPRPGVQPSVKPRRARFRPALALFLLAPFVGEFLLGNLTLAELPLGIILAPLYGCGALLVREVTRRTGRGWPTMVLLASAYALVEEGPVDQLLWNDSYAGEDLLNGPTYIPGLEMNVNLTLAILALHTIWSICVPIALVEAMVPERRTKPWLRTQGLVLVSALYLAGATLIFIGTYADEHFLASPIQVGGVSVVVAALIWWAFRVERRPRPAIEGQAPSPARVGLAALASTSLYWGPSNLITASWFEWVNVTTWCVVALAAMVLVPRWSRLGGWGPRHVFALAAGATLTYVWTAFPVQPESDGSPVLDLIGNAVFGLVAVLILLRAARGARTTSS